MNIQENSDVDLDSWVSVSVGRLTRVNLTSVCKVYYLLFALAALESVCSICVHLHLIPDYTLRHRNLTAFQQFSSNVVMFSVRCANSSLVSGSAFLRFFKKAK